MILCVVSTANAANTMLLSTLHIQQPWLQTRSQYHLRRSPGAGGSRQRRPWMPASQTSNPHVKSVGKMKHSQRTKNEKTGKKTWKDLHQHTLCHKDHRSQDQGRKEMSAMSASAVLAQTPQKCTWTLIQHIKNI